MSSVTTMVLAWKYSPEWSPLPEGQEDESHVLDVARGFDVYPHGDVRGTEWKYVTDVFAPMHPQVEVAVSAHNHFSIERFVEHLRGNVEWGEASQYDFVQLLIQTEHAFGFVAYDVFRGREAWFAGSGGLRRGLVPTNGEEDGFPDVDDQRHLEGAADE